MTDIIPPDATIRTPGSPARTGEQGFVLMLAMIAAVLPLLLILGASSQAMLSRQSRLEAEIADEHALLAAESGIDAAVYLASTPTGLTSGVPVTRNLGNGMSFTLTPTYLRSNGDDDDGDGFYDEADENVYQVLAVGTYGGQQRRLVAYLGPDPSVQALPGALTMLDPFPGQELHVQGASNIDGHNWNMDGTPGNPAKDTKGAMIEAPYTAAQLQANIPVADQSKVQGAGGTTPSVGQTATPIDMAATQLKIQNAANIVLTAATYNNRQFGNGQLGQFNVIYRNGNVDFRGHTRGAGVMFITGNLHTEGTFRFDGVIYVLGDVEIHGTASNIYGGIIVGTSSPHFYLEGTAHVLYSTEAITQATAVLPTKFLAFNGWREISRQ